MNKCQCVSYCAAGDSGPELWECETHGKTGLIGVKSTIEDFELDTGLTANQSWDLAFKYLRSLQKKYRIKGDIYFSEDYFNSDLKKYFRKFAIAIKHQIKKK